jgi:carbamate kinase
VFVVAALGGNALLRRGEPLTHETQQRNLREACDALAPLARRHRLVLTHGNGPQVGLLALEDVGHGSFPLDVLDAETEGMIGYLLDQAVGNLLPERDVATLLTQVVVDRDDPAFGHPTKPVGPVYDADTARRLAGELGWSVAPDGDRWRRVVASPAPLDVVELDTIELLVAGKVIVVCAGGGGIPVVEEDGVLRGVEAVVDKDAASALLAGLVGADRLLLLTDVPAVSLDWGTPYAKEVRRAAPGALREHDFASGSMAPKVDAACRFVEETGRDAAIGALSDAMAVLSGEAGTTISRRAPGIELAAGAG